MKWIFKLKRHIHLNSIRPYALVIVLSILSIPVHPVHHVMGQASREEPNVSLNVKNKPLGDVLKKISADTGYTVKLNNQWRGYPVSAALENMPLHQALKRILVRLSHTITYDSDKSIHIVIYAEAESRKPDPRSVKPFSPQIQNYQQAQTPSPEPPSEKAIEVERVTESPPETGAPGGTQEISTETKASAEQNEQKQVDEAASPDSSQKQN